MSRVAVVTGSNKGIGFGIVRALLKQFDGTVYLTARNVELGKEAVAKLNKEGLTPAFYQLDIADKASIKAFAEYIKEKHGGLDVLVNNAAVAFMPGNDTPLVEQAEKTNAINYYGTLDVCDALFPLLRSHARVVNVSSTLGLLKYIKSESLRKRLSDPNATIDDVNKVMEEYVEALKKNEHEALGFPKSMYVTYSMTKVALSAVTFIQQRILAKDTSREDLVINSCCPGYVATDLNNHSGNLTVEQGAETPVYLALLPPNVVEPRGKFVSKKEVVDWINEEPKY